MNAAIVERHPSGRLGTALIASALLHALVLLAWQIPKASRPPQLIRVSLQPTRVIEPPPAPAEKPIEKPAEPPKQFVTPSDAPEAEPAVPTPLRSERSSKTEKEQIKRGDPLAGNPEPPKPKQAPAKQNEPARDAAAVPKAPKTPLASGDNLILDEKALLAAALSEPAKKPPSDSLKVKLTDAQRSAQLSTYQPFSQSRPFSVPGSADLLPQVRDGEITLLNAKADRFAVFVRRVALQVFGALRANNWQRIPLGEVRRLRSFAVVKAKLSPKGKLLSVEVVESSGSFQFDEALRASAQKGAWDQNPPAAAINAEGNIEFLFKARTWARPGPPDVGEQRWLLLGTGLL